MSSINHKFFIGGMGSGYWQSAMASVANEIINNEYVCLYHGFKNNAKHFITEPLVKNLCPMNEYEFHEFCENYIDSAPFGEISSIDNLLGNCFKKTIILIDDFHHFERKEYIENLMMLAKDKEIKFYFITNGVRKEMKNVFDKSIPFIFKGYEQENNYMYLEGIDPNISNLKQINTCYSNGLKINFKNEESICYKLKTQKCKHINGLTNYLNYIKTKDLITRI